MYPHERSLVAKNRNRPFAIIGVNSDQDREQVRRVVKQENLTWRSFWNGQQGIRGPIAQAWNVQLWPTVIVIDHKGIIRHRGHGGAEMDQTLEIWIAAAEKAADKSVDPSGSGT